MSSHVSRLPDELWLVIFSAYLDQPSPTRRRPRDLLALFSTCPLFYRLIMRIFYSQIAFLQSESSLLSDHKRYQHRNKFTAPIVDFFVSLVFSPQVGYRDEQWKWSNSFEHWVTQVLKKNDTLRSWVHTFEAYGQVDPCQHRFCTAREYQERVVPALVFVLPLCTNLRNLTLSDLTLSDALHRGLYTQRNLECLSLYYCRIPLPSIRIMWSRLRLKRFSVIASLDASPEENACILAIADLSELQEARYVDSSFLRTLSETPGLLKLQKLQVQYTPVKVPDLSVLKPPRSQEVDKGILLDVLRRCPELTEVQLDNLGFDNAPELLPEILPSLKALVASPHVATSWIPGRPVQELTTRTYAKLSELNALVSAINRNTAPLLSLSLDLAVQFDELTVLCKVLSHVRSFRLKLLPGHTVRQEQWQTATDILAPCLPNIRTLHFSIQESLPQDKIGLDLVLLWGQRCPQLTELCCSSDRWLRLGKEWRKCV